MIIVAGESLIDMLAFEHDGKTAFRPAPGGSPYNVAMALGRLGVPVKFLGRFSTDPLGMLLAQTLERSQVDISLCPLTSDLSTLGFVMLDGQQRNPRYIFYTTNTAGCRLEPPDLPKSLPEAVKCLHFGSISLALESTASTLETLLAFKGPRRLVSVDPNIRPFLIQNREDFELRLNRFLASADLIKLSNEDLEWMHPGLSARSFCEKHLADGASLVVVTRGTKGSFAMNAIGSVEVAAESVTVADTVGAGDAFQAALLAWLFREKKPDAAALKEMSADDLRRLLRFAGKAAAINCARSGCNPPWRDEIAECEDWSADSAKVTSSSKATVVK